ncbi:MAG: endonuclease domain-containing protein [Candidatus Sericytochromatia bacterium]|nr:endonuclease domain-containing protein [Candidatus Sericytochromatia bacterium]
MGRQRRGPPVFGAPVVDGSRRFAQAMRHAPTDSEAVAWEMLRNRRLRGLKFRRQQVIRGYIVDFYCHELRLAVELDGPIHALQQPQDLARQNHLAACGIRVVRLPNAELSLQMLLDRITPYLPSGSPTQPEP